MLPRKTGVWAVWIALWLTSPSRAVDELRTAIVVNEKSADSLTIANHYTALRRIPSRCIVTLSDVPDAMQCSFDQFKLQILVPVLANLERRGLARQMDVIAYSADFPTAIDLTAPLAAKADLHQIFTKSGSINGLTYLYQLIDDEQLAYLTPRCNFYARPDLATLLQNPFLSEDREAFDSVLKAQSPDELTAATKTLRGLIQKHPQQWPLRYRLAQVQVATGKNVDAFQTITEMQRDQVAYRKLFEQDDRFNAIKDNRLFRKLLDNMPDVSPQRIPPVPFSSSVGWGQNGSPLGNPAASNSAALPGPSYLLSAVLAVTKGRGTTLTEAVRVLERAVSADGQGEKATFYFSDSSDVRSTTRSPMFKDAAGILRKLGHDVIIDIDRLPQKQQRLMGAMLGSANYDWHATKNTMLPGAIAENLTSTSGVLHQKNDQTSMVELLRGGAAGTSGTVTEPYALQFKFPTPYLFAYYAAGLTLVESFYLSVESPYQLLIVGDPLCRPYGTEQAASFEIRTAACDEQGLNLRLSYPEGLDVADQSILRLEVYLDGLHVFSAKPSEDIHANQLKLGPSWHTIDVVAISNHPLHVPARRTATLIVGSEDQFPKLSLVSDDHQSLSVAVQCTDASQVAIEHLGRRIWESTDENRTVSLAHAQTGYGPVQLRPLALVHGQWVAGQPQTYRVPMPGSESGDTGSNAGN